MAITLNGSAGVTTNSGAVYDSLQRGTAVTASGTSVDFTSIPSWVKRITVMFSGVSTNGTSNIIVQLGTGSTSYTTSGYLGSCLTSGNVGVNFSTGLMVVNNVGASDIYYGQIVIANITGNTWTESAFLGRSDSAVSRMSGGSIALAATLTAVRITTANGTDTFDAGSINILYE